jgi:hypothetical protein
MLCCRATGGPRRRPTTTYPRRRSHDARTTAVCVPCHAYERVGEWANGGASERAAAARRSRAVAWQCCCGAGYAALAYVAIVFHPGRRRKRPAPRACTCVTAPPDAAALAESSATTAAASAAASAATGAPVGSAAQHTLSAHRCRPRAALRARGIEERTRGSTRFSPRGGVAPSHGGGSPTTRWG